MREGRPWPSEVDYAWVDDWSPRSLGFCVAVIQGFSPNEVLARQAPNPPTGLVSVDEARRWAQARTLPHYGTSIEAGDLEGWSLSVEFNGYHATPEHVLNRLSERGAAAVIYASVNADMSFQWAVDGVIVRWFDPLLYPEMSWAGERLPEEEALPFGLPHALSSAFPCAERLKRVRLTREVLEDHSRWLPIGHIPTVNS